MATKAELEAEVEALKRSNSALKGQITRLSNQADEAAEAPEAPEVEAEGLDDHERAAVERLLAAIEHKGLANQIGNRKEVSDVRDLLTQ